MGFIQTPTEMASNRILDEMVNKRTKPLKMPQKDIKVAI